MKGTEYYKFQNQIYLQLLHIYQKEIPKQKEFENLFVQIEILITEYIINNLRK